MSHALLTAQLRDEDVSFFPEDVDEVVDSCQIAGLEASNSILDQLNPFNEARHFVS